jgi:hypothetical protein
MEATQRTTVRSLSVTFCVFALIAVWLSSGPPPDDRLTPSSSTCLGSTAPDALSGLLAAEPGGVIAADYQRAIELSDGRTLWLFQDATIRLPLPDPTTTTTTTIDPDEPPLPPAPTERLLHNIGMLQTGSCFEVLRSGTAADPKAWLLPAQTTPYAHWYWPLDAAMGADGRLYVHLAEMFERGALYLSTTEPVGTRIVGLDLATMTITSEGVPPSSSTSLYGFSIASDGTWTYLYGQCHRQFGWDMGLFGVRAHDLSCSSHVPVARVPLGQLFAAPSYWDGNSWQPHPARAAAVMPTEGRAINPSQVRYDGDEFVAVTKVDDWFGATVYLDRAPSAQGPWTNYAQVPVSPKCRTACNTYFASWIPSTATDSRASNRTVVGLSHNRWDGIVTTVNRPTFFTVPDPGKFALALRCSVVNC